VATYVTSDLHGYDLHKWEALVEQAGITPKDRLYVLGDVIDRGAHGVSLLEWMRRQPFVTLLRGNHEDMMLACEFLFEGEGVHPWDVVGTNRPACNTWLHNGGHTTYADLAAMNGTRRRYLLEYVRKAPLYATLTVDGTDYILVHAGLGGFDRSKPLEAYDKVELLWSRPSLLTRYDKDRFVVLGHTPTVLYGPEYAGRPIVTDTWMNIDVGVALGHPPVIVRLEDRAMFYGG